MDTINYKRIRMIVQTKNLNKFYRVKTTTKLFKNKYNKIQALKNISFNVEAGSCAGILGANGAGKSTLIKILTGVFYPDNGEISVLEHIPYKREQIFLREIGFFMSGKSQLIWDIPAIDSLRLSQYIYGYSKQTFNKRIEMFSHYLNIKDEINQPIRNMSLGQRMKLELMYSFLHLPKLVFLDEPTLGLDLITQNLLRKFIVQCNRDLKITFMISSHNIKDIEYCCGSCLVLNKGEIIFNDTIEKLKKYETRNKTIILKFETIENAKEAGKHLNGTNDDNYVKIISKGNEVKNIIGKAVVNYKVIDIKIEEESLEIIVLKMIK